MERNRQKILLPENEDTKREGPKANRVEVGSAECDLRVGRRARSDVLEEAIVVGKRQDRLKSCKAVALQVLQIIARS